jgi:hypothetical protein
MKILGCAGVTTARSCTLTLHKFIDSALLSQPGFFLLPLSKFIFIFLSRE